MSIKEWIKDPVKGLVLRLPIYLVGSLLVMYLLQMPMLVDQNYNFFKWFNLLFIKPFAELHYFSFNALSIYNLFARNNAVMETTFPRIIFSLIFMLIATAVVLVVYTSKKNRVGLVLLGAYIFLTLAVYFMDFSAMSLLPMLGILLLSFIFIKDKRLLQVFTLLSFCMILNACAVIFVSGGFSSPDLVELAGTTGLTSVLADSPFGTTMNVISSIIAILTHLYMTYIVLDITLSQSVKMFNVEGNSFGATMKDWLKSTAKKR
jgi:hypothetical protein